DTISLIRTSDNGKKLEAGLLKDGNYTAIHRGRLATKGVGVTRYARYDGSFYLAVQLPSEEKVTVYRNPLSRPVLNEQLPYVTVALDNLDMLKFGSSAQFLLMKNRGQIKTYDFEYDRLYSFKVPSDSKY